MADIPKKSRRPRRQFDEDFKAQAVRLVLDERKTAGAVARDLDLFRFIAAEKAFHSLMILCRCLRVTRSGFYAWQRRPESVHTKRDRHLKVLVRASFDASKHRYGSPRIYKDLREQDERVVPQMIGT